MGRTVEFTLHEFENEAIVAFIDLLGTRKFYKSQLPTSEQAMEIYRTLVGEFDIKFSEHFPQNEFKEKFNIHIFGDSIVISPRMKIADIVRRLVDFLLEYQASLLLNFKTKSMAIVTMNSFFSLKINRASKESILDSPYTNISMCGGMGVIVDEIIKGLPVGVYITKRILDDLGSEQKKRVIPVRLEEDLFFIKQENELGFACHLLPRETLDILSRNPNASRKSIVNTLEASCSDKEILNKVLPLILIHLGKENEIIRSKSRS